MLGGKRFIAVIPARGGSKGLPNKNILPLAGQALITYTIQAAVDADFFDEIMVTTDSEPIAEISRSKGASVPFLRPAELSTDHAGIVEVIGHVLDHYDHAGQKFDYVVLLQPTSPLRSSNDIRAAAEEILIKRSASVTSVCEAEHSPKWMGRIAEDLSMANFLDPLVRNSPRQKLEKYYRLNGAVYVCDVAELSLQKDLFAEPAYAYIMPQERSVDIDTRLDFEFAEFLMSKYKLNDQVTND